MNNKKPNLSKGEQKASKKKDITTSIHTKGGTVVIIDIEKYIDETN